jgi:hypothetical protein
LGDRPKYSRKKVELIQTNEYTGVPRTQDAAIRSDTLETVTFSTPAQGLAGRGGGNLMR